jgi:hypothetical protein
MALVIHRFWKAICMTMPKVLAWFITFNFINIAWVFFRAKEWKDAVKVLKGMFNIDHINIVGYIEQKIIIVKNIYINFVEILVQPGDNKLSNFLTGFFDHYNNDTFIFLHILISAAIVISVRNSSQIIKIFSVNTLYLFMNILLFVSSIYILSFGTYSEFLYFNF